MVDNQSSSCLVVGRDGERWLNVDGQLVFPRQTSIYVMCPWDHDIYGQRGVCLLLSLSAVDGVVIILMAGNRLMPSPFIFRSLSLQLIVVMFCRDGFENGCPHPPSLLIYTRNKFH